MNQTPSIWKGWVKKIKRSLDAFFLGTAMSWVIVPHTLQKRKEMERIFALESGFRLLGMPLLPGVYSLKLLPYLVPNILFWRRMTGFSHALEGADLKHLGH